MPLLDARTPRAYVCIYTCLIDSSGILEKHSYCYSFLFHHDKVVDFDSALMAALSRAERSKVYPAAKAAILDKYVNVNDIPKWSDIGTLVRKGFREFIINQLQLTDCGDVAEYLRLHETEIDDFVHRKVKSLREREF